MGRSFWLLWSGQTVSSVGDVFGNLAMGWLVYDLTGSKLAMGSLFLVGFLPSIAIWIFGGPLIDLVNRRRLMISLDLVRALAYAVPPLLAHAHLLQIWHLFALAFVEGIAGALFFPASLAILPSLVAPEQLVRANSLSMGAMTAANLIGPMLAGPVVAAADSPTALALDAASFAVSALTLYWLPAAVGAVRRHTEAQSAPYLQQLAAGYRFFLRVPALLVMMLCLGLANMGGAVFNALTVPWVKEQLGGGIVALGVLQGVISLGLLTGTTVAGWIGDVRRRHLPMLLGLTGSSLMMASLGLPTQGHLLLAGALCYLFGVCGPFWDTHSSSIYQRLVPERLRGRVMSVRLLVGQGMRPIGAFFGALLAERTSVGTALLWFGLLPAVAAALALFLPLLSQVDGDLRTMDDGDAPLVQTQQDYGV